jgi:hypothetical protein
MPRRQWEKAILAEIPEQLTPKGGQGPQGEKPLVAMERQLPSGRKVFRVRPEGILSHLTDTQIQTACRVLWVAARSYLQAEGWSFNQVRLIKIKPDESVELAFGKLLGTVADVTLGEMLQRHGSSARALRRWKRQITPGRTALDRAAQQANAPNAACGLSAQLAAANMNLQSGKVLPGDIIHARSLLPQQRLQPGQHVRPAQRWLDHGVEPDPCGLQCAGRDGRRRRRQLPAGPGPGAAGRQRHGLVRAAAGTGRGDAGRVVCQWADIVTVRSGAET